MTKIFNKKFENIQYNIKRDAYSDESNLFLSLRTVKKERGEESPTDTNMAIPERIYARIAKLKCRPNEIERGNRDPSVLMYK